MARLTMVVMMMLAAAPPGASADASRLDAEARFLRNLRSMMAALRPESVEDAARIQRAYAGSSVELLADRGALVAATASGAISPLPAHAPVFNVQPRLHGARPIGEKDLAHQPLYVAAHPGTLGCLLHVAARVRSAPLDVTSLVRHRVYQRALQRTNPNARTEIPMHALGLAFDISVLNVPLGTAAEIRNVLREMRDAGDLFFIAETRQLVFHVVPAPDRLPYYTELFHALASLPVPRAPAAPPSRDLLAEAGVDLTDDDVLAAGWMHAPAPWSAWLAGVLMIGAWGMARRTRRSRTHRM